MQSPVQRNKRSHVAAWLVVAAVAAAPATAAPISVPVTKLKLKNGLTVLLHEDHSVPRVYTSIRFRVGSSRETPGRTGFAHLFEHLMFEGSAHVPEGKFDQWLEAAGGENNAYTSEDETYYYEEVPSNAVELPLFLDSDRMGYFVDKLVPDLVDGQRDVVKNERRQSYENRPYGNAELMLSSVLWPKGHPYSWPVIGSMDDLTAAKIDDVRDFFTKWYAPENAILTVVGDFDTAQMKKTVAHWFSDVPGRGAVEKPSKVPYTLPAEKRLVVEDPNAPLPRLTISWPTVALFDADDANLDLAASVLSQGAGSRLQKRLVHDLQIAQSVAAYQQSHERAGEFHIEVMAQPGTRLVDVLKVVDEEMAKLVSGGIRDEELGRARTQTEMMIANSLDSLSEKASRLSTYEAYLGEPDSFERDLARYRAASSSSIVDTVKRRLGKGRVIMSVVPKGQLPLAIVNPTSSATVGGAR
jgi:zinc protease